MTDDGILSGPIDLDARRRPAPARVPAPPDTSIRYLPDGIEGVVAGWKGDRVLIRDRRGRTHAVRAVTDAFVISGRRGVPVPAVVPAPASPPIVTASGSVGIDHDTRVARGGRILVEGIHDAELLEKIWGDDLRYEGVVVEQLDGADDLATVVRGFAPSRGRRLGVLLDHLVDGSKEHRLATEIVHPQVLVTGHPFVDVWQAVRPRVLGVDTWPTVPRDEPWKEGVLARLEIDVGPARFWRELLARVESFRDLEPPLVGAVERLIDFVTEPTEPTS